MKSNIETCPACGEPMDENHLPVLLVPKIVWDAILGYFVRKWQHGAGNPNLN